MQQIITFQSLYNAYRECRRHKRHTANAQRYEMALLDNLLETLGSLHNRSYSPTRSIRFIAQKPKAREIHAADFSDRVVHHWLVPRLEVLFEPVFIHDVYSNRKGKGTHKAVDRLQSFMHSYVDSTKLLASTPSQREGVVKATICRSDKERHPTSCCINGALSYDAIAYTTYFSLFRQPPKGRGLNVPLLPHHLLSGRHVGLFGKSSRRIKQSGYYLQLDIKNFFNEIDRSILFKQIQHRLRKSIKQEKITPKAADTLRWLCHALLKHDTTANAHYRGDPALLNTVPAYKQLGYKGVTKGLPIGNLTSQFFANVYLNPLDQIIKHQLKCRHYLRYVDDFILLADSPVTLYRWREAIQLFLTQALQLELKEISEPKPIKSGVDFLGYITYPHYRLVRRRVVGSLYGKLQHFQRQLVRGSIRQGYWLQLKPSVVAKLRATLASYWGHFSHANSFSLRQRIVRQFPWLTLLFEVDSLYQPRRQMGNALQPCWEPKATQLTGYKSQIVFFQKRYASASLTVQRGTEQDLFPVGLVKKHRARLKLHVQFSAVYSNTGRATSVAPINSNSKKGGLIKQSGSGKESPDNPTSKKHKKTKQPDLKPFVTQLHIREQGYYKGGLKRRHIHRLHIQPGIELCPH